MTFTIEAPDLTVERRGNTETPGVWHFDSGVQGPSVLLTALIHGNELCGAWALKDLLAAGVVLKKGKLTLAFCNLAAFDRFDPSAHDASRFVDEDLNRVWTDEKLSNPVSIERQRALALRPWVMQADWLLDIHSMHESNPPLLMTGLLQRNIDLGLSLRMPEFLIADAGHKNGTRMRDFEHFGHPDSPAVALLIECGFHGDLSSVHCAQEMAGRFLLKSGILDREQLPKHWSSTASDAANQKVLEVTAPVVATSKNLTFTRAWQGMECVEKAGTVIGYDDGQPITTPYDNCVLVMPSLRQLAPGVSVMRFAQSRREGAHTCTVD